MKIVINGDYGGFGYGVSKEVTPLAKKENRTNPQLIMWVETQPHKCGDLRVVEIPNNATDWEINEYDGLEEIIYVVDGKIHYDR